MNFKLTLPQPLQKRSVRLLFCCDSLALVAASIAPPGCAPPGLHFKTQKNSQTQKNSSSCSNEKVQISVPGNVHYAKDGLWV